MRLLLGLAVASLVAGLGLVIGSVVAGGADLALVLIVPVVTGRSLTFVLGIALLFVGFFTLPFGLSDAEEEAPLSASASSPPPVANLSGSGVGGFVLVGPVPIVFGSWKGISRRGRWMLALGGAVLLTVALVWLVR